MPSNVELSKGTQFIRHEGADIAFDFLPQTANCAEKLLILVNGYGRNRGDFRAFRTRISAACPELATLSLDNRYSGETKTDALWPDLNQMARDVQFLANIYADKLNLTCFSALGISMGGMICQRLAINIKGDFEKNSLKNALKKSDVPIFLSHLILVSTTQGGNQRVWPQNHTPNLKYAPWPRDEVSMRNRMQPYFGWLFREKSPLLVNTMIKNLLKESSNREYDERCAAQFSASATFDGSDFIQTVFTPTLVITGDDDSVIPAQNSRDLVSAMKNARLVEYKGVGHLILIEEPEKFVADVSTFLHESFEETNPWN